MTTTKHTLGKTDYEMDCARNPYYHDGTTRKEWDELSEIAQWSWNRAAIKAAKGE